MSEERDRGRGAARAVVRWGAAWLAGMGALSVWAWIAADGPVVLHRDMDGEPTRIGAITPLLVVMPAVAVFVTALLAAIARWWHKLQWPDDPRPFHTGTYLGLTSGVLGFLALMHAVILADATGLIDDAGPLVLGVVGTGLGVLGLAMLTSEKMQHSGLGVNLPLPRDPAARAHVVRVCGGGLIAVGAMTVVAVPVAPAVALGVLVAGSPLLIVVVAAASLRAQEGERS